MKEYRYRVFTDAIEDNIMKGVLKYGDKLPTARQIKEEYRLSISSVQSGYDYLIHKGLVKSLPRFGYIVNYQYNKTSSSHQSDLKAIPRDSVFRKNIVLTSQQRQHTEVTALNAAVPSDFLIPQKLVLRTMQQVIREKGAALLRYYPTTGKDELRELISKYSAQHHSKLKQEEIIITDGALQALYIALSVTTEPNDIIAVESPCVFSVLEVIANLKLRTIEIPVRNDIGFDTDYLDNVCQKNSIKAILVTPNFHNPTGKLMSNKTKEELYHIASSHDIPIIENDIYGDLYFSGTRPSNISSYDHNGLVITVSSFSKSLAPGLRLGWMSAGRYFSAAERLKFSLGRSVSPLHQEVVAKILSTSSYTRHLRSFRHQLELNAIKLVNHFNQFFPSDTFTTIPAGGYSLWIELNPETDMISFYKACKRFGVSFTPGNIFSFTNAYDHFFRAVFSNHLTSENLEGIKKIGSVLSS
ncbi:PLP-dependent aminotransferase family protein [Chryseobacterium sp. RG1]|uniref:PLP-dependent aminotransferase family protein n=1 Tax=Chryseobacterium tagetis TaxID=2801334 RepID=A0ABS8A1V5_9FLAO|nr:PLP-dependent aminotransferase family protein [Chryseobacterium tagetis]MCA6067959.1 PLP-dependent aminotransferase family protein [Chryseobacterium tagetis]